jgi:uncharacterized membrane protein
MIHSQLTALTLITALGCGVIAGVFYAFSTFVMKALARLPAAQGAAAMQSINIAAVNPWFMTPFVGTAGASLLLLASTLFRWAEPKSAYMLTGGLLYAVGTFGVTLRFSVPLNDRLAKLDPTSSEAADFWPRYVSLWTAWNHVRAVAAWAATALLFIALSAAAVPR